MEALKDKKWHVYIAGNTEGPFSLEELRPRFAPGGGLDSATYAWCSGMADWEVVTSIADFGPLLSSAPAPLPEKKTSMLQLQPVNLEPTRSVEMVNPNSGAEPKLGGAGGAATAAAAAAAPAAAATAGPAAKAPGKKLPVSRGLISFLLLTLVAAGGVFAGLQGYFDPLLSMPAVQGVTSSVKDLTQPLVFKLVEKIPAAGQFVSPLPKLDGVAEDELEELKAAILGSPEVDGARVALALDRTDPMQAAFHVVSNLPDGTSFDIRIDGAPDRILNQLSFSTTLKATLEKRVGRSAVLRQADGTPIPVGQYLVHVHESEQQSEAVAQILGGLAPASMKVPEGFPQGRKLISKKVYFLGGAEDEAYRTALKTYLESVVAKAAKEILEVGQYKVNLEDRLKTSKEQFEKLSKLKTSKSQQGQWEAFHSEWTLFYSQLQQAYLNWTPELLDKDFHFGVLFKLVQQAGEAVFKVHGLHHGYFTGSIDKAAIKTQRDQALSEAEFALGALRTKLEQAEKQPKSPAGVPSREGL